MSIWGTFVFAKPLGRAALVLRDALPEEHLPAMDRLIQTLDEYLQATDAKARDVFRKAIGRPIGGVIPLPRTDQPDSLSDAEILSILKRSCGDSANLKDPATLIRFARAIEEEVKGFDEPVCNTSPQDADGKEPARVA